MALSNPVRHDDATMEPSFDIGLEALPYRRSRLDAIR